MCRRIKRLTVPKKYIARICPRDESFAIFNPLECVLILLLLMCQLRNELRRGTLPVMPGVRIVLWKVKLAVRIMRQHSWQVLSIEVEFAELPVVVFARMWVEAGLHGLRPLVELRLEKELVRVHF